MAKKTWVFDPNYGGQKIPDAVKVRTEQRLRKYAEEHFAGKYTKLDVHFRGQFCYVDAFTEPDARPDWPPAIWGVSREEYYENLCNSPTHLCRLRFFGDEERWGFAFSPTVRSSTSSPSFPAATSSARPRRHAAPPRMPS
jgi:hypothetical protein